MTLLEARLIVVLARGGAKREVVAAQPGAVRAALEDAIYNVERALDIARIQTVTRERALASEKTASPAAVRTAPAASTRTARKKAKKD